MRDDSRFNESQRKALSAEGNVLVSASAGSGKTTVLIEKLLRIIQGGGDIRRIAVMTFSRAAAAEMKNRLVKGLYDAVRSGSDPDPHVLKQLEAFPFASICTIDGFCYNLVKKYFAVIGADPSFKPLDPDESTLLLDSCIEQACEERLAANDEGFIAYAKKYTSSRRLDNVKKQIKDLRDFLKVQSAPEAFLNADYDEALKRYFFGLLHAPLKSLADRCEETALRARADGGMQAEQDAARIMCEGLRRLAEAADDRDCRSLFYAASFLAAPEKSKGRKADKEIKDFYNDTVSKYGDFLKWLNGYAEAYPLSRNDADIKALVSVTQRVEELYSEAKKREGGMDFADMGAMALKILEDEGVRKEVRDGYDYVFVDEYQDTNYLQEKLLRYVSNGNNVFTVGDVKQAIYHFRYAEPEIFHARMTEYASGIKGQNVLLNENYRSRKGILDFVNACCAEIMTEEFCSIDYRRSDVMQAGAKYEDKTEAVEIYLCGKQDKSLLPVGIYSVKDADLDDEDVRESYFVADYIRKNVEKGLLVYRPKKGRFEKLRYGDIAVLCRKKNGCKKIGKALGKFGIPYLIAEADENAFAPRELLVDVLRLCVSAPDISLVNAMLSVIGNFTAAELMEIRSKAPKIRLWEAVNAYNGNKELESKIKAFLAYVAKLREMSVSLRVSDLLIKILGDGPDGYFSTLGADVGERIYKFVEAVKRMDCNNDVRAFLQYYEESYKGENPSAGQDSVSVMTLHKSKGLEFPVVIIPFIDERAIGTGASYASMFADKDLGIALKYVDDEEGQSKDNFATKLHKEKIKSEERQELARLTYVGFTRAENKLVITGKSLFGKKEIPKAPQDASSIADFLGYAVTRNPKIAEVVREAEVTPQPVEAERRVERTERIGFGYLTEPYAYAESVGKANKYSVSEILEQEAGVVAPFAPTGKPSSRLAGTAYHLIMQRIDLNADETQIRECVKAHADSGEIEESVAQNLDVKKIVDLLNSDVIALAKRAKIYREQPFVYRKNDDGDSVLIQGVIDLLIEEEDGLTVVDYKASGLNKENLAERYLKQLEIYSEAASKIWKKPIKRRILFNVLQNYEVEV